MSDLKYYGQNCQDYIMDRFFDGKVNGVCIDIGAMEGQRFSNSYFFELYKRWTVIRVQAHPTYFQMLQKNRSCIRLNAAAGPRDDDKITFYGNDRGALSTVNPNMQQDFKKYGKYFTGFKKYDIPMVTLNSMIGKYLTPRQASDIDFVSIDVQGTQLDVLKGLTFGKYRPKVFIIQNNDYAAVSGYLADNGYDHVRTHRQNAFYIRKDLDRKRLDRIFSSGMPQKQFIKHPLD